MIQFINNFNDFIESPISQYVILPIGQYLVIPLLLIIITYCIVQRGLERFRHSNTRELKIDDYYQEVSKDKLISLLQDWTDLLSDTSTKMYLMKSDAIKVLPKTLIKKNQDDKNDVEMIDGSIYDKVDPQVYALGQLVMTTWLYGKHRTNKLLSNYQQHNFKKQNNETNYEDETLSTSTKRHNTKSLVYIAMIIVSLRKDLMNIETDPMELISLKITDITLDENYKLFSELLEEVKREL